MQDHRAAEGAHRAIDARLSWAVFSTRRTDNHIRLTVRRCLMQYSFAINLHRHTSGIRRVCDVHDAAGSRSRAPSDRAMSKPTKITSKTFRFQSLQWGSCGRTARESWSTACESQIDEAEHEMLIFYCIFLEERHPRARREHPIRAGGRKWD